MENYTYRSHTLRKVFDAFWREDVWMLPLTDILYDGKSIKNETVTQAYLNSYSPWFYLELGDLNTFRDELLAAGSPDIECHNDKGHYLHCYSQTKTCDDLYSFMKPLAFKLDGTTYTIPPEGYTESNTEDGYKCVVYVSSKFDSQSIDLGTLFMQSFVVNYDYKSGAVRFGVNSNAPEGTTMVTD